VVTCGEALLEDVEKASAVLASSQRIWLLDDDGCPDEKKPLEGQADNTP
jgi:hypothetical protein